MDDSRSPIYYGKLVRDLIPLIIQKEGKEAFTRNVKGPEFVKANREKLLEEAYEFFHASCGQDVDKLLTESADVLEVILTSLEHYGLNLNDLVQRVEERRKERGRFIQGVVLESVNQPWSDLVETDQPRFVFSDSGASDLLSLVRSELERSEEAWIASAFYTPGIINILTHDLNRFIARGGNIHVILSTTGNFTAPEHIEHLRDFIPGLHLRVYHPPGIPFDQNPSRNFHVKAYLFRHRTGKGSAIIGSSNFTEAGFRSNIEWNYYTSGEVNLPLAGQGQTLWQTATAEFTRLWGGYSVDASDKFLAGYRARYRQQQNVAPPFLFTNTAAYGESFEKSVALGGYGQHSEGASFLNSSTIRPNPVQSKALVRLNKLRSCGAKAAAVIAATGVGKTYLAAMDYVQSGKDKILYIAHRENILHKARQSFVDVLGGRAISSIYSSTNRDPDPGAQAVFGMIQTLSRKDNLEKFHRNEFDYIVVDEFHHASAKSYHKVLDYFRPEFLLGLTATPERMDGGDVLRLCENTVAYELRLLEAVDQGLLSPFQYFAVYDPTDYSQIAWKQTDYDEEQLNNALMSDTRTAIIAHNVRRFLPYSGKTKALAFCSSVKHAHYTANRLGNDHGLPSMALVGSHSVQEREEAMCRLQDEQDSLNVLCCVDIFNEGVDIPRLSHVLFLRPTQSFTIFLQQLGRGLRRAPGKEQLVVIDFVGNFKNSHVAPLALSGFTSVQDYAQRKRDSAAKNSLPQGCFLSPALEVQQIWNHSIRAIAGRMPLRERLLALYNEIRQGLGGGSPGLMDFFAFSRDSDPKPFIAHFGSWIKAKQAAGDLNQIESEILETPAERFLEYLENDLSPTKSYKMVVIKTILNLTGNFWSVENIALGFKKYFLQHKDRMYDYDDMARASNPELFPIRKVEQKLMEMPLSKLSNKNNDWFILDKKNRSFSIKDELIEQFADENVRSMIADRTEYALAKYFYKKSRNK